MRVIAGSARGRTLHPPVGNRVRPTADKVKEAVFSSLASRFCSLTGLNVLDLFAGSGSLGIEALSRGAGSVVFVDSHADSINLTRKNLQLTGFDKAAVLLLKDAVKAVQQLCKQRMSFDIILADPPYADKELTERVLNLLADSGLTAPTGIIVFETDNRCELPTPENFQLAGRKVYGDTAIWMYERTE